MTLAEVPFVPHLVPIYLRKRCSIQPNVLGTRVLAVQWVHTIIHVLDYFHLQHLHRGGWNHPGNEGEVKELPLLTGQSARVAGKDNNAHAGDQNEKDAGPRNGGYYDFH